MSAIRSTDTKPERELRSALHRSGYRFRKNLRLETGQLKVRPDIVFTRQRVAVFVDGCFWHVCPEHGRTPTTNTTYWSPKLQRNVDRDRAVNAALAASGWQVVRIWVHEPLEAACARVIHAVKEIEHTFDHRGSP